MKAYLVITGSLFTLLALAHLWWAISDWQRLATDLSFDLEAVIGLVAAGLSVWAWRLLRLAMRP